MIKIYDFNKVSPDEIFARVSPKVDVSAIVMDIIENVKKRGDDALYEYCKKFDGACLTTLEVSQEEIDDAYQNADPEFVRVLNRASENIRKFHSKQKNNGFEIDEGNGIVMGQKVVPVDRAGLYVPGGTAAYPSTVLMDSIPAIVAGVKEVVMVTPPGRDGKVNPVILTAAKVAGVNKIYKVGGAQAIAALAYGTQTIPKVDKIVGPGNAFVAEAKKQVFGQVSIDMIAGPSEIMILADGECNPKFLAADLLSQAEHDKLASAVLVTDSYDLATRVSEELEKQIPLLSRSEIARTSIDENGKIIVTENLQTAIDVVNEIAPEHLELCVENPFDYLPKIRHAGSIFMGKNCPEALGDYLSGTNHTLPTSGTAKFSSPLSVDDFVKKTQYTYYTRDALKSVAYDVHLFANKEGLTAHAKSAIIRIEDDNE